MNNKLKMGLQSAFEAPIPKRKAQFLKTLRYPKISYLSFLGYQFAYIRKRVWLLSAFILLMGWTVSFSAAFQNFHMEASRVWTVSAILPFLTLLTVTEIFRSAFDCMAELETSCRFNLSQIVMARISILGTGNFIVLSLLLILINRSSHFGILRLTFYLLVPYLITCSLCLLILNRSSTRESMYGCAAAAGLVGIINMIIGSAVQFYSAGYLRYWILLSAAAIVLIGFQIHNLLKQTEDKTWNLLLTE
ncbi:hypothetical protein KHM83_04625 [Fusibacter paucivorans]|uniref:ABC-2 family transporter protein n=1 Tax=Fusibacter paucivorans TaxID=76009 RepID=A0ABS5PPL5_9FIRM|nr:hypothetical protein [Fusibacter paucivorans]MBS7525962.1 hypothetical protein [Fusibacter paucivorans]